MKTIPRILAAAAAAGALLMAAAPAHAADGSDTLDLISTKRVPVSVLPGPVPLVEPLLHPHTIYDSQDNSFVIENLKRDIN
ncbi:hypothetical protein [Streptomyces sp. NPDC007205]|uniref:hypothetical protein n=1 Tax=Streptomyces sp. NPDC007205 TaxID=3154316 RepID=UPI0033C48192